MKAKKMTAAQKKNPCLIKNRKMCSSGHEYAKHKVMIAGYQRCAVCLEAARKLWLKKLADLNARRAKAKKGHTRKLHGNYAGEKRKRSVKKSALKAAPSSALAPIPAATTLTAQLSLDTQ